MIVYVKRKDIDIEKYDRCIENSINSRIYAYSWYLDIVADNWDILVLGDYEAVMPLPWRSKYFIKYIYPPCWTQQLGVFSSNEIDEVLIRKFIKHIPNKFRKVTIQFNSGNPINGEKFEHRVNYILELNKPYDQIFHGFGRSRKQRVNKVSKDKLLIKDICFETFMEIVKFNSKFVNTSLEDYKKLDSLTFFLLKKSMCKISGIYSCKDELIGASIFLLDNKRITYLYGVANTEGYKKQSMTFLLNNFIFNYSKSNLYFDFEGSMLSGVSNFFKSFGALKEKYCVYKSRF